MGLKVRNGLLKTLCVILCWALMIAPCVYLIKQDFAAPTDGTVAGPVPPLASSPLIGETEAATVLDTSGGVEQDFFANSSVISAIPADKTLFSATVIDPFVSAGQAPALRFPTQVVVPDKELETEEPDDGDDSSATVTPGGDTNNGSDLNINGSVGFYGDYALLSQPDGSTFIYYDQTWEAYDSYRYGNSTIGGYGCGPTSMAMVVSNLTDTVIKPTTMGDWSYSNGYFVSGRGTAYGLFNAVSAKYGIPCTTISSSDKNAVVNALRSGKLLLTIVGRGDFTRGRHFLLIRGITADGKLLLADSGNYDNCHEPWDYDRVLKQVSGGQFWVFG